MGSACPNGPRGAVQVVPELDGHRDGGCILVVEDDREVRGLLARILGKHHEVRTAVDGPSAIDSLRADPPDAILTDLMLPGASGLAVLAAARERCPTTPVVLITAYGSLSTALQALRLGAFDYILKPFEDFDVVTGTVARALESRALRLENQRLLAELSAANRFKADMLRVVAHDLNNMLTCMAAAVEMARACGVPAEPDMHLFTGVLAAREMQSLIQDLTTFGRLDARALTLHPRPFPLLECVRNAARLVHVEPHRHRFHLPRRGLDVRADSARTMQILVNLLSNAVKYSPRGGTITVEMEEEGGMVRTLVRDRGVGIPPEALDHLFTWFYRAERDATAGLPGIGLGLYVVKNLVEMQGGTVRVESQEGQGSTFSFTLPRAAQEPLAVSSASCEIRLSSRAADPHRPSPSRPPPGRRPPPLR